jgi:type IV secretion system protein VirB6
MGFFADFNNWLNGLLLAYVSNNVALVAAALEPAIVTLGALYVAVWGYMHLSGRIDEPFATGAKRLVVLALLLGASLSLWAYNELIVDTFFTAPSALAAAIVGAYDPVGIVDRIFIAGDDVAAALHARAGVLNGDISFYFAEIGVYVVIGFTALYTMFLLTLSRIALSVLLALGPLFLALMMFESTKKFAEAWFAQLANYAFISILTVLMAALMLTVVSVAAEDAARSGGGITIVDAVRVCLAAGMTLLVMRQVMPMAAGLAGGLALSTFSMVSAAIASGFGRGTRAGGQFARGLMDDPNQPSSRWDPLSRMAGHKTRVALRRLRQRPNTLQAS